MAVRKATRPCGYDNCAFSYRWLDSSQTPLELTTHIFGSNDNNTPGRRLVNKHATQDTDISVEGLIWLDNLSRVGRDFDRVYRILADEYYREKEDV